MSHLRVTGRAAARLTALGLLTWTGFFVHAAFRAPFPLDSFEDYEIWRGTRLVRGDVLYRPPGAELFPTPYPPAFYLAVATAQNLTGRTDYFPGRLVSALSFLAWVAVCYVTARRTGPLPALVVASLIALGYRGSARYYTIGRPDMLMGGLLALSLALLNRRSRVAAALGGVAAAGAVFTKQTAVPIVLVAAWLVPSDRRAIYLAALGATCLILAASFPALGGLASAWYWCVFWPSGHGFSWSRALTTCLENWETSLAILVLPVILLVIVESPMGTLLLSLVSSFTAFVALGKWGAIENHFLIALVPQTMLLARHRPPRALAYAAAAVALVTLTIDGLPDARELHWFATRREEVCTWANAVRELDAAVAHYAILGAEHGARFASFSDLALKLPGYRPAPSACERLLSKLPPVIVLSTDPSEWNSMAFAKAFTRNYAFRGRIEFKQRSGLLPSLVFERRHLPVRSIRRDGQLAGWVASPGVPRLDLELHADERAQPARR